MGARLLWEHAKCWSGQGRDGTGEGEGKGDGGKVTGREGEVEEQHGSIRIRISCLGALKVENPHQSTKCLPLLIFTPNSHLMTFRHRPDPLGVTAGGTARGRGSEAEKGRAGGPPGWRRREARRPALRPSSDRQPTPCASRCCRACRLSCKRWLMGGTEGSDVQSQLIHDSRCWKQGRNPSL